MASKATGETETITKPVTIEVCDICEKPMQGVYPRFKIEIQSGRSSDSHWRRDSICSYDCAHDALTEAEHSRIWEHVGIPAEPTRLTPSSGEEKENRIESALRGSGIGGIFTSSQEDEVRYESKEKR